MQHQINKLIEESNQIAEEVRLNNWAVVQAMAETRQRHLEAFFSKPITTDNAQAVSDMIHQILEIDRQVANLVKQEKNKTAASYKDFSSLSRASKEYRNVSNYSVVN